MQQNKASRTKRSKKKPFKNSSVKETMQKIHFFCFPFLKLSKPDFFFQKQDFYIWMKGKNRLASSNKRNWETHEKIALKGREA